MAIAFVSVIRMLVKYKGKESTVKHLQGTLLGLLLFLVLINDGGFEGQENNTEERITSKRNMRVANGIHLKYVDDLTLAEAINLPKNVVSLADNERHQPDMFHARTGHVLPLDKSKVHKQPMHLH